MLNFKTTAELKISKKIAEQIIGQDQGLQLIKKAAQHRRHVLLIGHSGTGKCVGKDVLIPTAKGQFNAKELYEILLNKAEESNKKDGNYIKPKEDFFLYSVNENGKVIKSRIIHAYKSNDKKQCLKITSNSGAEVILSGEHPILTTEKGDLIFKKVSEIKKEDNIGLARKLITNNENALSICLDKNIISYNKKISYKGKNGIISPPLRLPEAINKDLAYFLGIYVAEGDYSNGLKISTNSKAIQERVKEIAVKQFDYPEENIEIKREGIIFRKSRTLTYILEKVFDQRTWDYNKRKILSKQSSQKRIPKVILNSSKEMIWAFLSGYIDGDGHFDKEGCELISASKALIKDVRLALLKVEVLSRTITKIKFASNTELKKKREYSCLKITGNENLKSLYNNLHLFVDYKKDKLQNLILKKGNTNVDLIYGINEILQEIKDILKINYKDYGIASGAFYSYINRKQVPSRNYVKRFTSNLEKDIQELKSKKALLEKHQNYIGNLREGTLNFYKNIQKHPDIVSKRTLLRYTKGESAPSLNTICSLYAIPNNTLQIYGELKDVTNAANIDLNVKITHGNPLIQKTRRLLEAYNLVTLNLNDKIEKLQILHKKLNLLASSDLFFDKIKKVEVVEEEVYDFEVEGTHNFIIGEGIVVHNSLLGQALAELLPTKGELQDILCYPNEKDPNNPIIKTFPAEEGEKTIVKLRGSLENSLSSRRLYLLILGSTFVFFLGYLLWSIFKSSPYGPIAIVQGISTVVWILFIGFLLMSRAPGFLKSLTGLAMIPKPLITHKKEDPAPFLDATGSHSGALLGDVLHDPLQSFFTTTKLQQINEIKDKRNVLIEIQENNIKSIVDNLLKKSKHGLIKKDNYEAAYLRNKELQILSERNNEIKPTTVLSVNRYKSDKPYLIKLTTETGKTLLVTPEHKVAVKKIGRIIYKEAKKLSRFDKVVSKGN